MAATYFVNDGSTNGDVYCTGVGATTNSGTNAASPKSTLTEIITNFTLVAGDTVFIDTGLYTNQTITLPSTVTGAAANKIIFQGSTNYAQGGTVFDRQNSSFDVIFLSSPSNLKLRDLTVKGGRYGIWCFLTANIDLERIIARNDVAGFNGDGSPNTTFIRCVAISNTTGVLKFNSSSGTTWDRGISWYNGVAFSLFDNTFCGISNSVIGGGAAFNSSQVCSGDYNIFWDLDVGGGYNNLAELQVAQGVNKHSTYADPMFYDPANLDFHPKSTMGRFDPAVGHHVTNDTLDSVLIDFGDPQAAFSNEIAPNGFRINAGVFGNTSEASQSPTSKYLIALSYNDGGSIWNTGTLYWTYRNLTNTFNIDLQYTTNEGTSWVVITNGIPVTNMTYTWDATSQGSKVLRWRVIGSGANTNVFDVNDARISLNGALVPYYVNDGATNSDVYCSRAGSDTNSGIVPDSPMLTITNLIASKKINPNSIVYIDTGIYSNYVITLSASDAGVSNAYVILQGSTNYAAGGSVLNAGNINSNGVVFSSTHYVRLKDLTVENGHYGVWFFLSDHVEADRVTARNNFAGFYGDASPTSKLTRCVAIGNTYGLDKFNTSAGTVWDLGLSWSNSVAFSFFDTTFAGISNSVIVGGTAFDSSIPSNADFNALWSVTIGGGFQDLDEVQKAKNSWWHSAYIDPLFVDPVNGDFHPRSSAGHFNTQTGTYTNDIQDSPLVDFGDPSHSFTNEPAPNGSRVNASSYGDSSEASKSRTNSWLLALTYNDGGTLSAPGDVIYWTGGNLSNQTVRIELSSDSGGSWQVVQTNLIATNGSYTWANTNFGSTLFARWRVVLESNTNVFDATDADAIFHSGPFVYYLNDASQAGDVYATAPGSDANLGTSANSPKSTLQSLMNLYDIEPGDIIFIDTGVYILTSNQVITALDGGNATNHVSIRGSTNTLAGGTVFDRQNTNSSAYALNLNGADYVDIQDISVRDAGEGIRIENSQGDTLTRVTAQACGLYGLHVRNSSQISIDRSVASGNSMDGLYVEGTPGVNFKNGIFWKNNFAGIQVDSGYVAFSNSVVIASGRSAYGYYAATTTNIVGNYNDLFADNFGVIGFIASSNRNADTLSAWIGLTRLEQQSVSVDPQFTDGAGGNFHLQTATPAGRFVPGFGFVATDTNTSPLIDAGDPAWPYTNEPAFNGSRVDIGLYGNTGEASKGRTNAWLFAATHRNGGWAKGTSTLHWVAGNFNSTGTVTISVSTDGGNNWGILTNGVRATNELVQWNTLATNDSPACLWSVVSQSDTNVVDATTNFFAIRNSNLMLYVNNNSTNGDVYTTAPGLATNWLASASAPLDSLALVFDRFDLEPGDRVFVDTGPYSNAVNVTISRLDSGASGMVIQVIGNPSAPPPSTMMFRQSSVAGAYGLVLDSAQWLAISNIGFRAANAGVVITNCSDITLSVRSQNNASNGVIVAGSTRIDITRDVISANGGPGLLLQNDAGLQIRNSIISSNLGSAVVVTGSVVSVSNSVLIAGGDNVYAFILAQPSDVIYGDYNDILLSSQAQVANVAGAIFKQLSRWQQQYTNDVHSLTHDPLFADAGSGDFHLMSTMGRFQPGVGTVTDSVSSLLIDAADPLAAYGAEPAPNGGRRNIGLYGNTTEASLSPTNGWLVALTLSSGGSIRGTNSLYWVAGGAASGVLVHVDYSADGGVTWTNIATNIAASAGSVVWTSTTFMSSTLGKWRIVSQSDTNIFDETDSLFSLNNGALDYYVNDASTAGDVYTYAVGSPLNDGLSAFTPKRMVEDVIRSYDLFPGDRILVDTGRYASNNAIVIGSSIIGSPTNRIIIQGSTNEAAGGTVIDRGGVALGFDILGTVGIGLKNLVITNAFEGIRLQQATNCLLENIRVEGGSLGIEVRASPTTLVQRCAFLDFRTGIWCVADADARVVNSFFYTAGVSGTCVRVDGGNASVSNSVLWSDGNNGQAYGLGQGTLFAADYNDVLVTNGAIAASRDQVVTRLVYDSVSRFARDEGNDVHSLTHDPNVFDVQGRDFHPVSTGGRYAPASSTFVNDGTNSVLIDAGDPASTYSQETAPNGSRRNIGLYGDTAFASRTPSNGYITTVTLNDGGRAEGTNVVLYWVARGSATGALIKLEYSSDDYSNWVVIATGLQASSSSYIWNTQPYTSSVLAAWRIRDQNTIVEYDRTDRPFALRNQPISFYVNDGSTNGDVYTTAIGSSTNLGLTKSSPKASLQEILDAYDLEAGDTVYIDTGAYSSTSNYVIAQSDTGDGTNRVLFIGSTNSAAGGTVFSQFGVNIRDSLGVEFRNITMAMSTNANMDIGFDLEQSTNTLFQNVKIQGGNVGIRLRAAYDTRMIHCSIANARTNGLQVKASLGASWQQGVFWSNTVAVYAEDSTISVSNSVVSALVSGSFGFQVIDSTFDSDYNDFYMANGAVVAYQSASPVSLLFDSVSRWTRDTSRDRHSLTVNPDFANALTGDFHLHSIVGRYVSSSGAFTNDSTTSPLIDAGDPGFAYTNEPSPNGQRVNIGMYGNTAEASKTPTNGYLTVVSLNDGGRAEGTNVTLNWVAQGAATGHLVRIEFSSDAGVSWQIVASNVSAASGTYTWDTTSYTTTVRALWKVSDQTDTNATDTSDALFALRNAPVLFYVNDNSTNGDVYCTAKGNSTNLGLSAAAPLASLSALLNAYDIEAGDTIFIDTGVYTSQSPIVVGQFDSADTTNAPRVIIQGSTNSAAGGTVLNGGGSAYVMDLESAVGMDIRNLTLLNAQTGMRVYNSYDSVLRWVQSLPVTRGFEIDTTDNCTLQHCVARNALEEGLYATHSFGVSWLSGVIWSNGSYGIQVLGSVVNVSNSVIEISGPSQFAYYIEGGSVFADYNDLYLVNSAASGYQNASPDPSIYQTLSRWVRDYTQDVHSLSCDPKFFSPDTGDFHLQSTAGRYVVTSDTFVVTDTNTSSLVDAGNPSMSYTNETIPNGGRADIGLYGDTFEASRTPTNPALTVVSLNDGGRAEGSSVLLYWLARGAVTSDSVRLDYSSDAGTSWQPIATNVVSSNRAYVWNSMFNTSSVRALWRVASEVNTGVFDSGDTVFALRNVPLSFYVNDNDTAGDVYSSAVGNSTNQGYSAAAPCDSLQTVLDLWDIEPGDTIYVDTGLYQIFSPVTVTRFDAGTRTNGSANRVTLQGSTNQAYGGTIFQVIPSLSQPAIDLEGAHGVEVRNFTIRNASAGLKVNGTDYGFAQYLRAENCNDGADILNSLNFEFKNCAAIGCNNDGVLSQGNNSSAVWENGLLWSNRYGAAVDQGSLTVMNSILGSFGGGSFAYYFKGGVASSDYNNVVLENNAFAGAIVAAGGFGGGTTRFDSVAAWVAGRGQDIHSLTFDPAFANSDGGDFHLKSKSGRYDPFLNTWVTDTVSSLLIDSGNPDTDYSEEPVINGGRVNIDPYGGTWQASKTPTNGWLSIISLNDGGDVFGTNIDLRFFAGWIATGHLVSIDYSPDNGSTWTNIVSNYPAADPFYVWNSTNDGRSATARWRITDETDPTVNATNADSFILRNGGTIPYFVNDDSVSGDVYCLAPGNDLNSGLYATAPVRSIQLILATNKLQPRDIIYVDTGVYLLTNAVTVDDQDAGKASNEVIVVDGVTNLAHVILQGSTNKAAGGTIIDRQTLSGPAFHLLGTRGIEIRDFTVRHASAAVFVDQSEGCVVDGVTAENNTTAFSVDQSSDVRFDHDIARLSASNAFFASQSGIIWESGVMWDNPSAVALVGGTATFRDSVLEAIGSGNRVFNLSSSAGLTNCDFNDIVRENGALIGERASVDVGSDLYGTLLDWQGAEGQDSNSLSLAPFFADDANGDFHLQSTAGRLIPGVGYTNDPVTSPLLDTGDPAAIYTNEPSPNGSRIDIGAYGNTGEASLSPNGPSLLAISLSDGGVASGTGVLIWAYANIDTTSTVRLEISVDGGIEYLPLASNVPIASLSYVWDACAFPLTTLGKWRITSELNTNVSDTSDNPFAIKCQTLTIYVNDGSTNGDIYTTATGSSTNTGLTPGDPLLDPADALRRYPISGGDVVYIDTGEYLAIDPTNGMALNELNRGSPDAHIAIHGSTNELAGGTVIDRANPIDGVGLSINLSKYVDIDHIKIRGASVAMRVDDARYCTFDWIEAYSNTSYGFIFSGVLAATATHCVAWNNGAWGLGVDSATELTFNNGVLWSNAYGSVDNNSSVLTLLNSVLHSYGSTGFIYSLFQGTMNSDFNILYRSGGSQLARDTFTGVNFLNLKEWQDRESVDSHSVIIDPQFIDPGSGDFHLRSQAGRYAAGTFVTDTNTSWAIDAASFNAPFANEPSPNGSRMNAGLYGNTFQASKSLTTGAEFLAVSLNDGGVMNGDQLLYWLYRGIDPTTGVRVEFSPDDGSSWILVSSNLIAASQGFVWSNTNPPTPVARWRVVDELNTNVYDAINTNFILRVGPIHYFVNDTGTFGDVYTYAPGSPTNSGLASNAPVDSIQLILDRYDLAQGDVIYVDTGVYTLNANITFGQLDGGTATSRVSIIGSTNLLAGGTVLRRATTLAGAPAGSAIIYFPSVIGVGLENLIFENSDIGVYLQGSGGMLLKNDIIRNCHSAGVFLSQSANNQIERSVITQVDQSGCLFQQSGSVVMDSCVIWSNGGDGLQVSSTTLAITNSVLQAIGEGNACIDLQNNAAILADYNDFVTVSGATYGTINDIPIEGLPQWTYETTQDVHSLAVDPLFANPSAYDYHPQSRSGRYDPTGKVYVTTDTNTSLLIDTGNPISPFGNEPAPNGGRLNIGLYGNTEEASKSNTNAWLLAITASSGGRLEGIVTLAWAWGGSGIDPTNNIILDYSFDDGVTWTNIATVPVTNYTTVPVTNNGYLWLSDTKEAFTNEKWPSSPIARWKITLQANTNISDITDTHFALRNKPFFYYVNDNSLVGDLYTTAVGSDTNLGLFPYAPKATLKSLLQTLDVEGADTIYLDTGVYTFNTNDVVVLGAGDQGTSNSYVVIRSSTNFAAGGTRFVDGFHGIDSNLVTVSGSYVDLRDMRMTDGNLLLSGQGAVVTNIVITNGNMVVNSDGSILRNVRVAGGNLSVAATNSLIQQATVFGSGVSLGGANITLQNSLVVSSNGPAVSVAGVQLTLRNNTIVGKTSAFQQSDDASLSTLQNNILVADGTLGDAFCIRRDGGLVSSDYNDLVPRNGAWIGNFNGYWERLAYWQRESGQDLNSMDAEPQFANEAAQDFHVKSKGGRYLGGSFTNDAVQSPAIDAGSPATAIGFEQAPNGGRVNIGAYGGTDQASKSYTNGSLVMLTASDGGVLKGSNVTLRWIASAIGTGITATVSYSPDGGSTWTTIVSGITATNGSYAWNSTLYTSSLNAALRISIDGNTSVVDQTDAPFALRNVPLNFYVNDTSTVGDVYTTTNGSSAFNGLSPQQPLNSIQAVLTNYDVESLDTIYIDSGIYAITSDVVVIWSDGGDSAGNLVIRGSTNVAAGGTVIARNNLGSGRGFDVKASHVTLRDLTVQGADRGVYFNSNRFSVAERLLLVSNNVGMTDYKTVSVTNRNLRLWNNNQGGIDVNGALTTRVENCTFVGNATYDASFVGSSSNVIQNSIFYLNATNSVALTDDGNTLFSAFIDYNIYWFATNNVSIDGVYTDMVMRLRGLAKDYRSSMTNPLLQNVTAGDFHVASKVGRYKDSVTGFVVDAVDSWAIDRANPSSSYTNEPQINGARANIGAYGNTEYASKGTTNLGVDIRVLNTPTALSTNDNPLPVTWTVHDTPPGATVRVEYSGDNGLTWIALGTNIPADQEYLIWSLTPIYNTYDKGLLRVVGEGGNPYGIGDTNNAPINIFFGEFAIGSESIFTNNGAIVWRGAWGENYQVQYADTMMPTNTVFAWSNAVSGAGQNQQANFQSTLGGDFTYQDTSSTGKNFRIYRVILEQYEP